jgi:hypothetical protein
MDKCMLIDGNTLLYIDELRKKTIICSVITPNRFALYVKLPQTAQNM